MKQLTKAEKENLLTILKERFEKNMNRHLDITWKQVLEKISVDDDKLYSLNEMEKTGGEPDVVFFDKDKDELTFFDCSKESPIGRRNTCYDREALEGRKNFKPANSAMEMAIDMGINILDEKEYRHLQELGEFDLKTSSWIKTPSDIRKLGGAIFCDRRYNTVFIYHNGADSYYSVRGFRASLKI